MRRRRGQSRLPGCSHLLVRDQSAHKRKTASLFAPRLAGTCSALYRLATGDGASGEQTTEEPCLTAGGAVGGSNATLLDREVERCGHTIRPNGIRNATGRARYRCPTAKTSCE
jgi:hypothetical protein